MDKYGCYFSENDEHDVRFSEKVKRTGGEREREEEINV